MPPTLKYLPSIILAVLLTVFLVANVPGMLQGMYDYAMQMRAGQAVLQGLYPYTVINTGGGGPYFYTPFFPLVYIPLAVMPAGLSRAVWVVLSLSILTAGVIHLYLLLLAVPLRGAIGQITPSAPIANAEPTHPSTQPQSSGPMPELPRS